MQKHPSLPDGVEYAFDEAHKVLRLFTHSHDERATRPSDCNARLASSTPALSPQASARRSRTARTRETRRWQ